MYGYRYGEVLLPKINPIKDGTHISIPKPIDLSSRPVVQVSLGCHLGGAALPHPCPKDPATTVAGVRMRFARKPPRANPAVMAEFKDFVSDWIQKNLVPLEPTTDLSVETWLKNTNYPKWRKDELLRKWEAFTNMDDPNKKYRMCKSFMKDETYPDYKHARGINSRSDEFKCFMGPVFKAIESVIYENKHFIKHVPVADRPRVIMEALFRPDGKYVATDYTAFESLFTKEIMEICEFQLYDYMTSKTPIHDQFMHECWETLGGENVCAYKTFVVRLLATRMSGEMCTSLGNGFSNLMYMLFLCKRAGCTDVRGFIEGDDGIFSMVGPPPTAADFALLGQNIKIELHDRLSTASFCGIIFDEDDCVNVTDPREILCTFGYTTSNYSRANIKNRLALLRCKGLSLAHQYPGCPVIMSLARYALRVSTSYDIRGVLQKNHSLSMWEREQLISAMSVDVHKFDSIEVPFNTRVLVADKYNLPIEYQLLIEKYLDSLTSLQTLKIEILLDQLPISWSDYYNKYGRMMTSIEQKKDMDSPSIVWPVLAGFKREW